MKYRIGQTVEVIAEDDDCKGYKGRIIHIDGTCYPYMLDNGCWFFEYDLKPVPKTIEDVSTLEIGDELVRGDDKPRFYQSSDDIKIIDVREQIVAYQYSGSGIILATSEDLKNCGYKLKQPEETGQDDFMKAAEKASGISDLKVVSTSSVDKNCLLNMLSTEDLIEELHKRITQDK